MTRAEGIGGGDGEVGVEQHEPVSARSPVGNCAVPGRVSMPVAFAEFIARTIRLELTALAARVGMSSDGAERRRRTYSLALGSFGATLRARPVE